MDRGEIHPDYANARPAEKAGAWTLEYLWERMNRRAEANTGEWIRYVLPRGAWVGLFLAGELAGRVVRIFRRDPFQTDEGPRLWQQEVDVFARVWKLSEWDRIDGEHKGGPMVTFTEPDRLL